MKKWNKLTKKDKDRIYGNLGFCILITSLIILVGMTIANIIIKTNKTQYFYGKGGFTYHSKTCWEEDNKLYCNHAVEVNWFYEESKHE